MTIDLETGATDAFRTRQIQTFVGTSLEAFDLLAEQFPDHRDWPGTSGPTGLEATRRSGFRDGLVRTVTIGGNHLA